jgi:superfamily I DNA and/or RNA helicase
MNITVLLNRERIMKNSCSSAFWVNMLKRQSRNREKANLSTKKTSNYSCMISDNSLVNKKFWPQPGEALN